VFKIGQPNMASKGGGGKVPTSKKVAETIKPWSKNAPWWMLAIEAVIAGALGLYVLTQSDRASTVITYALAAFLLVDGLLTLIAAMRGRVKTFGAVRGGVGILGGIVLLLMPVFGFGSPTMAAWVIGLALVIGGAAGLLSRLFEAGHPINWISVLVTVLMIALGGVYIYSALQQSRTVLDAVGWLLLAVGIALGAYAAYVWNETRQRPAKSYPAA
jgi:uncharacterized membrane protein HdeD (DUF308 family)